MRLRTCASAGAPHSRYGGATPPLEGSNVSSRTPGLFAIRPLVCRARSRGQDRSSREAPAHRPETAATAVVAIKSASRRITMRRDIRHTYRASSLIVGAVLTALLALTLPQSHAQSTAGPIPTDPSLKVAFIGDSGDSENFIRVLGLIKSEGAVMVMHQGDFDYARDPNGFFATIDSILGPDFPYFASVGNHDNDSWNEGCSNPNGCYTAFLKNRMARIGAVPDDPNLNDEMYSVTYRGLKMVFVGQEGTSYGDGIYAPYPQDQLATDDHIWRICRWHKDQNAMQVGGKDDEMGWRVYETCKDLGAIIATAHEHSYHRT